MTKLLADPPLIEVVCEFRFAPGTPWDWLIPSILYDRFKDDFPLRADVRTTDIALAFEAGQLRQTGREARLERVAMQTADRSAQVQIGTDRLIINHSQPYPGWDVFSEIIMQVSAAYVEVSGMESLSRIGVRYINAISISRGEANDLDQVDIGSIITLDPPIPESIGVPLSQFQQRYMLQYADLESTLMLQTLFQHAHDPSSPPDIILDLDFFTESIKRYEVHTIREWLAAAHDKVELAFQACINPDLLAQMKEGTDNDGSSATG